MKVDYHIHTLCSDGVCTVEEVLEKIRENQIASFAISDHDTIAGLKRARELCPKGSTFTTGLEITCAEFAVPGIEKKLSIHLLGYGFDEDDPDLNRLLDERGRRVENTFQNLVDELGRSGYPAGLSGVPISCGVVLQLSDVLAYMKEKYAPLPGEIEELILSWSRPLTESNITLEEGIRAIHNAGGTTVWAHPFIVYREFKRQGLNAQEVETVLKYLIEYGLDGMETDYLDFPETQRVQLRQMAEQYGIMRSAGSDFHGSAARGKMGVEILSGLCSGNSRIRGTKNRGGRVCSGQRNTE